MKVISVVNQKGGCGKTTLAVNLAAGLAKIGKSTLLIDLDPQAHATFAMGYTKQASSGKTSFDIFLSHIENTEFDMKEAIIKNRPNISFIPANMLLSTAEISLGNVDGAASILSEALQAPSCAKYDYVIIDSPPSFGFLTLNSMYSSDMILAPIDLSYFSFNAINSIYRVTGILGKETQRQPEVFFVFNIFDGRSLFARQLEQDAKVRLGEYLLSTKIRSSVRLRETSRLGKTIFEHDPKSASALDYYNLTSEIVSLGEVSVDNVVKEFLLHAPEAGSVFVLGDFNGWKKSESTTLNKLDNGRWSGHFNLKKGKYRYKFLVDGKWVHDPSNPDAESNIFGSLDSVITIDG